MSPQEIDEILQRFLNNESTPAEKEMVEQWFNAIEKEEKPLTPATRQALQKKLWSSLPIERPSPQHRYGYWARIAASLLLLAVCSFYVVQHFIIPAPGGQTVANMTLDRVVVTSGDAEKRVTLSDSSVVTLKPHSEIRFPSVFGDKREVSLSGEALFEVARNVHRPFLVYANEVTTRVLGTSFVIKAYARDQEVTVAVKTGKVSVYTAQRDSGAANKQEIILTPNQQIVYHRNESQTEKMLVSDPQTVLQQPAQKLSYANVPVTTIFRELEERYGIPIQFDAQVLSGCTLIYADLTDEDFYGQIEIICNALGARYKKSASSIVIEAEGCK
jgi:ferric-dicitrate binding protein FerR (iron transport regulator)